MPIRVAAVLVVLAVTSAMAQPSDAPEPPPGANSWSLRIHTTGGFTGQGIGSVTISSNGQMACGPAPCATPIAATMLQPVSTVIASVVNSPWILRTPSGLCRDCVQTTITLKRRDGDLVEVYRASWDDSQPPSAELRELRRLAFELRAARAGR
jgi:hypothetical protein